MLISCVEALSWPCDVTCAFPRRADHALIVLTEFSSFPPLDIEVKTLGPGFTRAATMIAVTPRMHCYDVVLP